VVAAIAHATGVRCDEIPVTPERLMRAMALHAASPNGGAKRVPPAVARGAGRRPAEVVR
jgi:hypothetical protein